MNVELTSCFLVLIIFSLALAISSFRRPSEHTMLVVFRLGRFIGVRGPGPVFLVPLIDRAVAVDMREQERSLSWEGNTSDQSRILLKLQWRHQVFDPEKSILAMGNVEAAIEGIIRTYLRRVISDMDEADLRFNRKSIEVEVEAGVREKVRDFGVVLRNVEIREIRKE